MVIGISLGWNCSPAILGVEHGIRKRKEQGYKTCPFDEMISSYNGVVQCIKDDFADLFNPDFLELKYISSESKYCSNDLLIYNKKYKFLFNHESPGHANLWKNQNWQGGIYHFVDNNYEKFQERYRKRIENFRNYLNSGEEIIFLIIPNQENDFQELRNVLIEKYPLLVFSIRSFPFTIDEEHYKEHMKMLSS